MYEDGQLWIGQETKFGELEGKCRKLEEEDGCLRLEAKVGWFTNWWMIRVGLVLDGLDGSTKNGTWRDDMIDVGCGQNQQ
jgi:hypothetical protein